MRKNEALTCMLNDIAMDIPTLRRHYINAYSAISAVPAADYNRREIIDLWVRLEVEKYNVISELSKYFRGVRIFFESQPS